MIRQIYDGALPTAVRRNYKNVMNGYSRIVAEEGTKGLMRGVQANVLKAIALNVSFTGPYDYIQEKFWIVFGDTGMNRPAAILGASVVATAASLPIDHVKTRL